MKGYFSFIALLFLAGLYSCSNVDTDNNSPALVWKKSLTPGSLIIGSMFANVQFNNGVLLAGMDNNGRCLYFINSTDGSIRWKWNDYFSTDVRWLVELPFVYQNKVLIVDGRYQYCIDLDNGKTAWKKMTADYVSFYTSGNTSDYFITARQYKNVNGTTEGKLLYGNLLNGIDNILSEISYSRTYTNFNNSVGDLYGRGEYIAKDNFEGVLINFSDPLPEYKQNFFLGLYNLKKKMWEYDKKPFFLNASYGMFPSLVVNNFLINAVGKTLQCNNILTGEPVWSQTLSDLNSSKVGLADGKLIVTTQDRITHCIDPVTGKELWALTTSGNPGIVHELNGIAYFVGGNAKLFAIDVAAGKILWQFSSPDQQQNSNAFWQEGVRVVPGTNGQKGKVIVSSYLNGYCYEAIR